MKRGAVNLVDNAFKGMVLATDLGGCYMEETKSNGLPLLGKTFDSFGTPIDKGVYLDEDSEICDESYCSGDAIELLTEGELRGRELSLIAYRLCVELQLHKHPVAVTTLIKFSNVYLPTGITDVMLSVAKSYLNFGNGVNGLIDRFEKSFQNNAHPRFNAAIRLIIIDFCRRLRTVLGIKYGNSELEISHDKRDFIYHRSDIPDIASQKSWWYNRLQEAIFYPV